MVTPCNFSAEIITDMLPNAKLKSQTQNPQTETEPKRGKIPNSAAASCINVAGSCSSCGESSSTRLEMGRKNKAAAAVGGSTGTVKRIKYKDDTDTDDDFEGVPYRARTMRAASPSSGSEREAAVEQRRVSPKLLVEAMKLLNDRQRRVVQEMGFGQLFHLQVEAVPGKLVNWCLERFQPSSCSLGVPKNAQLHIVES